MGKNTEENRKKYDLERVQANSLNPLVVQSDEITARREAFEEKLRLGEVSNREKMTEIFTRITEECLSLTRASKGVLGITKIYELLNEDEDLAKEYARACEIRSFLLFDEIIEIADTPVEGVTMETDYKGTKTITGDMIRHRELQIEARKWVVAKMNPKKFGNKVDLGLTTDEPISIVLNLGLNKKEEE
jgi:hypothetical protein